MQTNVIVVGSGKLASELLVSLREELGSPVTAWENGKNLAGQTVVVHAGSGRELAAVTAYCRATQSPLLELATGSKIGLSAPDFPVVLCPNTNILMLKFMSMLEQCGHLFHEHRITLTESHQAQKTSVPGTAVAMARALGLQDSEIISIRDAATQQADLGIPEAQLGRHAYHRILIEDGDCSLKLETRVQGESPYAAGVARIISAVQSHALEKRIYPIMEFVNNGWV